MLTVLSSLSQAAVEAELGWKRTTRWDSLGIRPLGCMRSSARLACGCDRRGRLGAGGGGQALLGGAEALLDESRRLEES